PETSAAPGDGDSSEGKRSFTVTRVFLDRQGTRRRPRGDRRSSTGRRGVATRVPAGRQRRAPTRTASNGAFEATRSSIAAVTTSLATRVASSTDAPLASSAVIAAANVQPAPLTRS